MKSRLIRIAVASVAALVIAGGIVAYQIRTERVSGADAGYSMIGGTFALVDQDGRTVTRDSVAGRYVLKSVGFTYCPDESGRATWRERVGEYVMIWVVAEYVTKTRKD